MIIIVSLGYLMLEEYMTRYEVFIKVIETGSFTKAAQLMGYTQSAVSQMVHTLETELGTKLVERSKNGIVLTKDGESYYSSINGISAAFKSLEEKHREIMGLNQSSVDIGTFTSISRNWLPQLMNSFKRKYPNVRFQLHQGEYTSIEEWIKNDDIDFGFVYPDAVSDLETIPLYSDKMKAVLPPKHPLCQKDIISLADLVDEDFILLDEGEVSVVLNAFNAAKLEPDIQYKIYDDYTILAMIEQGLGVSVLYTPVLEGMDYNVQVRPLAQNVERTVALARRKNKNLSVAAKKFADVILKSFGK